MKTDAVSPADLRGVFAVPPLARRRDSRRALDHGQNERIVRHVVAGGITRLLYGGNAFLYHLTLAEYEELLGWLAALAGDTWVIPAIGPSYGRAMDQAPLVRRHAFPTAMLLPCGDPRDASGLARGIREIADALGTPVVLYLKDDHTFGVDVIAGLDAVAALVDAGLVCAIKYAIVRTDPAADAYLDGLLSRVDRARVVSGMGEKPAIVHLRDRGLPGFTTGSGCVAPAASAALLAAAAAGRWDEAGALRLRFLPLETLRDAWGPARVLHAAVAAADIADVGPIPPYVSELGDGPRAAVRDAAMALASISWRAPRAWHRYGGSQRDRIHTASRIAVQAVPAVSETRDRSLIRFTSGDP
jgi:dihydrodipicolinate synthase/N-acetylneuraminate lyase